MSLQSGKLTKDRKEFFWAVTTIQKSFYTKMLIITLSNNKLPNFDEKISWYCHWLNIRMKLSCMLIIRPNTHSFKFHGGIQDTKFERKCGWV